QAPRTASLRPDSRTTLFELGISHTIDGRYAQHKRIARGIASPGRFRRGVIIGEVPGGAPDFGATLRSSDRRRPQLAADARRQSREMASGAYHVVLRNLCAFRICSRLPA